MSFDGLNQGYGQGSVICLLSCNFFCLHLHLYTEKNHKKVLLLIYILGLNCDMRNMHSLKFLKGDNKSDKDINVCCLMCFCTLTDLMCSFIILAD